MKAVFPCIGELKGSDLRMFRLAEFLGVNSQALPLATGVVHAAYLERAVPAGASCLVVNPSTLKEWVCGGSLSEDVIALLFARFRHIIVHGLREDPFDSQLVSSLSRGRLKGVRTVGAAGIAYQVSKGAGDICGRFAGLTFGPANAANDRVMPVDAADPEVNALISIDGQPFMAMTRAGETEIFFIAGEDTADLERQVGDAPLAEYFSQLVPQAAALRYAARDECWRPDNPYASIIIDDPLLRKRYGFLDFDSLLRLANHHNFHATIAFIPHNFRRNSPRIIRMFRENAARLSICFHGNDHTDAEFASHDPALLNTFLTIAEGRMAAHLKMTGLACDKVIVFPQGNFSVEAMEVLRCHNFYAAVNTVPYPTGQPERLTIAELAQPAVLRYGDFPLFLRKPIRSTRSQDIAFNVFFGRPILIVEHHEVFERPESLAEISAKINSLVPDVRWSNLANVVSHSTLTRVGPEGTHHVRGYSNRLIISNDSSSARPYSIEWTSLHDGGAAVQEIMVNGNPSASFECEEGRLRLTVELDPGASDEISLVHRNMGCALKKLGVRWNAKAFLRRRLSEFRDNHLSKNQHVLTAAKALQRRLLKV